MTSVLDRAHFDHMTGGDLALQLEILDLFRAQADSWRTACAGGEGWREGVHKLKGSARGIGLGVLAAACAAAEEAPEEVRGQALATVLSALAEALAELERFARDAA